MIVAYAGNEAERLIHPDPDPTAAMGDTQYAASLALQYDVQADPVEARQLVEMLAPIIAHRATYWPSRGAARTAPVVRN